MKDIIIVDVALVLLMALVWWNGTAKDGGFEGEQARKYRKGAGGIFGGGFWG